MCTAGMDTSCGFVGSVPVTTMVCVTSDGGDLSGDSVFLGFVGVQ